MLLPGSGAGRCGGGEETRPVVPEGVAVWLLLLLIMCRPWRVVEANENVCMGATVLQ